MQRILILPGLRGSGPRHWQSWFEKRLTHSIRVNQRDWNTPDLPVWSERVRLEIERAPGPVLLVAHSFGCLAAIHASSHASTRIAGAMLVAPADPKMFGIEPQVPKDPLRFPAIVVASETDCWISLGKARSLAQSWGAEFVNAGAAGHINVASGHGRWPEGLDILKRLQHSAMTGVVRARSGNAALISG
ncbi:MULTISPECIES: alpha/beta hydrolase [Rhodomicrobium]|uniref:RBBP9/YdeN family alpha/beta hydrolase n=1 Tax=Rhodomicrobium TaxID=1068 RepID=UPI000B4AD2C7|nr:MULTISPECIES: alpha/beta hydrolase [Rhodomicrobium]